jgi:hypothetical protein
MDPIHDPCTPVAVDLGRGALYMAVVTATLAAGTAEERGGAYLEWA